MVTMLRQLVRTIFAVVFLIALAVPAAARAPALSLGEVSLLPGTPARYRQILTETLNTELSRAQLASPRSFVVNARLSRLRTEGKQPAQSSCTVALVLTDGGSIFAMAEGRVRVQDDAPERAEVTAVQAAARSALKSVSRALHR
jgi:hypothetical protein